MDIKKAMLFLCLAVGFAGCGTGGDEVETVWEDGVEVVLNRDTPARISAGSSPVGLMEEWVIDLERKEVYETGLYSIDTFSVDAGGFVYVISLQSKGHHIFKFGPDGRFERSFGQHGRGPGELAAPFTVIENAEGELVVTDRDNAKLVHFDKEGGVIREIPLNRNIPYAHPLPNGKYIVFGRMQPDLDAKFLQYPLELCDENLEPVKVLDTFKMENFRLTRRLQGTMPGFGLTVGGGKIYIGNEARGYEIRVFDSEGALVRKIRKAFIPEPVDDDLKEKILTRYNENVRPMIYFPETLPPFRTMAADEFGSLYVTTFEKGRHPDHNRIDVFNPEGELIGVLSASVLVDTNSPINTIARNGRFYHVRETESGFKQLVTQKILF
ncbi:MAG: 6-bladed beta-propeller [Acidobacteria bacterium]|nr:6-bladed beta-propeller [Acidobacteriota bacterium]MBU1475246.1 6-bladed beta-propeller [Acidobacteriota bacterium]